MFIKRQYLMSASLLLLCSDIVVADEEWNISLTPYVWAAAIDGQVGSGVNLSSPVESDNSFFALENLDSALFVKLNAKKGEWAYQLDYLSVSYKHNYQTGPLQTHIGFDASVLDLSAAYEFQPKTNVVFGMRYFDVENEIDLTPGPQGQLSKDWTDPYIGINKTWTINDNWSARGQIDLGGFGVSADLMTNAEIEFVRKIENWGAAKLGYRYLASDFSREYFTYDVSLSGLTLGFEFEF